MLGSRLPRAWPRPWSSLPNSGEAGLQTPGWEAESQSLSCKHHRAVLLQLTSHETHLPETACKAPPRFSTAPQAHSFPAGSLCPVGSLGFDFT